MLNLKKFFFIHKSSVSSIEVLKTKQIFHVFENLKNENLKISESVKR